MVPALMAAIASVRSQRSGTAPSSSKVRACTSLGSTRMRMPFMSAGRADGAQPVGDLAEAVLEPAEDAIVHALLDLAARNCPSLPSIARARRRVVANRNGRSTKPSSGTRSVR